MQRNKCIAYVNHNFAHTIRKECIQLRLQLILNGMSCIFCIFYVLCVLCVMQSLMLCYLYNTIIVHTIRTWIRPSIALHTKPHLNAKVRFCMQCNARSSMHNLSFCMQCKETMYIHVIPVSNAINDIKCNAITMFKHFKCITQVLQCKSCNRSCNAMQKHNEWVSYIYCNALFLCITIKTVIYTT